MLAMNALKYQKESAPQSNIPTTSTNSTNYNYINPMSVADSSQHFGLHSHSNRLDSYQ